MSWQQLIDIGKEAVTMRKEDDAHKPIDCPNHGEPLKYHDRLKVWFCPEGDYRR